uniref:O-acyltransferase n=1 Tax=Panagrellus redivivus TaxID=6233 RepID=A0A7E4UU79_PANRE
MTDAVLVHRAVGASESVDAKPDNGVYVAGRGFKSKEFKVRPSMLTTYFEGPGGIAFNFMMGVFILLAFSAVVKDVIQTGNPVNHFWLIWWNFRQLPQTLFVWGLLFASNFPVLAAFKYWALIPSKSVSAASEAPWMAALGAYYFAFFYLSIKFLFDAQLACACSFIITCENTRIAMKLYAFIRENIPRGIAQKLALADGTKKLAPGSDSIDWPTPAQYTYYFFCPSFIYRDSYPLAPTRSWSKVATYFLQALGCIYYTNLIFTQLIYPQFEPLNYHTVTVGELVYSIFPAVIPGFMCLVMLFYGLLHCWLNAFAEALYFGDRHFYGNWWNSKHMAEYYRVWNLVVHEYMYEYIYKDLAQLIGGKRGLKIAQAVVFFTSSLFHEYWFGVSLRLFYPIMFVLYFIIGGVFFSISRLITKPYAWNIAMFFNLLIGTGMFVSCYASEWYARQRCESVVGAGSFADFLVPRLWTC